MQRGSAFGEFVETMMKIAVRSDTALGIPPAKAFANVTREFARTDRSVALGFRIAKVRKAQPLCPRATASGRCRHRFN